MLLMDRFLSTAAMGAVFAAESLVRRLLDFEAALAMAEAEEGLMPMAAARCIVAVCADLAIDGEALAEEGARAGSVAIALVRRLTEAVGRVDADAAGFVHRGATSQDVIDTAMVLATRDALAVIDADLARLAAALRRLAERYVATPMLARTLMQPAQVTSFGFKAATGWLLPLLRAEARLARAGGEALQLQFGGAVGTLATLGPAGPVVARRLADRLGLALPASAWHVQRDAWVALACEVGVLCGSLGKIGRDWSLLAQGEVGEMAEPSGPGRGGSSAMPNKRNPVAAMIALAAAARAPQQVATLLAAMPQEYERGLGGWQAELAEWPHLFLGAHGSLQALADAAEGLQVDAGRMRANIEAQGGAVFAEAAAVALTSTAATASPAAASTGRATSGEDPSRRPGKAAAHALLARVTRASARSGRPVREQLEAAIDADASLRFVDRAAVAAAFDIDAPARHAGELARALLDAHPARMPMPDPACEGIA